MEYFNAAQRKHQRDKRRARAQAAAAALRSAGTHRRLSDSSLSSSSDSDSSGGVEGGEQKAMGVRLEGRGLSKVQQAALTEPTYDEYGSDDGGDSDDSAMFAGIMGSKADFEAAKARADVRRRVRQAQKNMTKEVEAMKELMTVRCLLATRHR